jgi:hypothetical protein
MRDPLCTRSTAAELLVHSTVLVALATALASLVNA